MTCHCGSCEDHRPDTVPGGWQWSDTVGAEVKEVIEEALAPIIKSDRPNSLAGYYGKNTEERTQMAEKQAPSLEELAWATVVNEKELGKALIEEREASAAYDQRKKSETEQLVEEAKEYAEAVTASRRQLLTIVLTTNEKNDRFIVRVQGESAKVLYDQETGIEPQYLAHAAEDYVIPLRNLLENLGYEVQEIYI